MSIFDKVFGTPEESAKLKQLKDQAAKRRSSKSSAAMPKVDGKTDIVDHTVAILNSRINKPGQGS